MSAKPNIRAFHPENERLKRAYLQHVHQVSPRRSAGWCARRGSPPPLPRSNARRSKCVRSPISMAG